MFSTRVSALGLAKNLSASIPHTTPVSGVTPYHAEKHNFCAKRSPHSFSPLVAGRGLLSSGVSATVNAFGKSANYNITRGGQLTCLSTHAHIHESL